MTVNLGYWAMVAFGFIAFGNTLAGGLVGLVGGECWYVACQLLNWDRDLKV